ncbi:MAG: DUF3147 family protein [Novosphingobium sp.]
MMYFAIKVATSALIIAAVSEIARRSTGIGALLASLPLIAVLSMIWLWRDTGDTARLASYSQATFWYVLPSLPMFLVIPALLCRGVSFWPSLALGCALTMVLYAGMAALLGIWGVKL